MIQGSGGQAFGGRDDTGPGGGGGGEGSGNKVLVECPKKMIAKGSGVYYDIKVALFCLP